MKNNFKFKKIRAVKSADMIDGALIILLSTAIFAVLRVIRKIKAVNPYATYVDWGSMALGAFLAVVGDSSLLKSAGATMALTGLYGQFGPDIDKFLDGILNFEKSPSTAGLDDYRRQLDAQRHQYSVAGGSVQRY